MIASVLYESPRNPFARFAFEIDAAALHTQIEVRNVLDRICAHKQTINHDTSFYTVDEYRYRYEKYHELNAIVLGLLSLHPALQSVHDQLKEKYGLHY